MKAQRHCGDTDSDPSIVMERAMRYRILVVEDDEAIRESLDDFLSLQGYEVLLAADGATGLRSALEKRPDLLLLDVMLPLISGFDLCRALREKGFTAPIVMLTALADEVDRVVGLEVGADDYVVKPFGLREVHARIRAHLRREERTLAAPPLDRFGPIVVDRQAVRVYRGEEPVSLSTMEFKLLCYLIDHPHRAIRRDELLDRVWGFEQTPSSRTVDTHILNLRKKVGPYFGTVHGVGYRFDPEQPD